MKNPATPSTERKTIPVLYCHFRFDSPTSGGEWVHHYLRNDLAQRPDIRLQELGSDDLAVLVEGNKEANRWFMKKFRHLPDDTIVIQEGIFYKRFFLANWSAKIRRHRPRFLLIIQETPYLHGMNLHGRIIEELCFRLFLHSADAIVTDGEYLKKEGVVKRGVPASRVMVNPPAGQEFSIPKGITREPGQRQILCASHIRHKKGQETLIEALRYIDDESVTVVFTGIVKQPQYFERLKDLVRQYGFEERVQFVGYLEVRELEEAFARSAIFVFPSLYEPYGIVAQEAMFFGIPIVASNVGGIREQVTNGVEGLLVRPGDPEALAQAIRRVITEDGLRESLVRNAYKRLESFPTWDSVTQRVYELIRSMSR